MGSVETSFVTSQVGKIQVRRGGSGDPIVYLHSAAGEGEALLLLDLMADHGQVVAPMFPGFGESEGIDQIDDMEDAVFHLLDLWGELGLDAPTVVAQSLGGWMALELATRYPERVGALVLVNPVGLYIEGAPIKDIFGRSPAEMADDFFADKQHPMAQMMRALGEFRSDPTLAGSLTFDLVAPVAQTMAATAKLGWDPYLHNPKLRRRLHRVAAPTVIVRGEQDTLVPDVHARTYAEEIPDARLVGVDDAAHLLAIERPERLAEIVAEALGS